MSDVFGSDAYSPREIAERVENVGVVKATLPPLSMAVLGILAGAFIGLGAAYYTIVAADATLGVLTARLIGGVAFSLGLILVVLAGAELFTGNNLLVMAWVARRITALQFLRNLAVVYAANLAGAVGLAGIVALSHAGALAGGSVGRTAVAIAAAKVALPFGEAFLKGVLCNVLVCLAVWLAMAGRSVADKILGIVFPVSAFVAAGFEHSVANMYFIPLGILLKGEFGAGSAGLESLDWIGFARHLLPVTLGNLVGGCGLVGLVYHLIYRRGQTSPR